LFAAQGQARFYLGQSVGIGAQCRQSGGALFQHRAYFQLLAQAGPADGAHGIGRAGHGPDIGAVSLAHFQQAGIQQYPHGFAHGIAADAQQGGQFRFGGNAAADRPLPAASRWPISSTARSTSERWPGVVQSCLLYSSNHPMYFDACGEASGEW
jgi:hypothetical protein